MHQRHYVRHLGYQNTIALARKQYFWPGMKHDVAYHIAICLQCQQVKVEHQHLAGVLQPLPIMESKWEVISMDFIAGLHKLSKQNNTIMVIMDKLTK